MLVCKKLYYHSLLLAAVSLFAQNIQNPVLPGVADAGVMKYNGKILYWRGPYKRGFLCIR